MRNLLALGAAALIGFAGIGWYLGWYKIETAPTTTGRHISIDLNTPKIKEDVGKGKEKLRDILTEEHSNSPTNPSQSNSPVTPAGFQRTDDGGFVYPAGNTPQPFNSNPPSGTSPMLPPPR